MHILLPIACMCLFCLSPADPIARFYVLYWFIPIGLYFIPLNNTYLSLIGRAFKSTFTAHALGSVIWVYLVPMSGEQWVALIPVVAIERLCMVSLSLLAAITFKQVFLVLKKQDMQAYAPT